MVEEHSIDNDFGLVVTDMAVVKEVSPAGASIGDEVTWTISWMNLSPVPAENVELVDVLPNGVSYISSTPTPDTLMPLAWNL